MVFRVVRFGVGGGDQYEELRSRRPKFRYLNVKKYSLLEDIYYQIRKMVVQLRPRAITVDRGSRGFGLSLIYKGLDKYEEKDTGIYVARVVPGGQAQRFGVKVNDKILTINGKTPRNVDDAVGVIKQVGVLRGCLSDLEGGSALNKRHLYLLQAGGQIKLMVLREEDVTGQETDGDTHSLASGDINSSWVMNICNI